MKWPGFNAQNRDINNLISNICYKSLKITIKIEKLSPRGCHLVCFPGICDSCEKPSPCLKCTVWDTVKKR